MSWPRCLLVITFAAAFHVPCAAAQDDPPKKDEKNDNPAASAIVEKLAESAKKSLVVVLYTGRDGKQQGLGTGFVVKDGLVATNFHVIGEGRPITVRLPDGSKHDATEVYASDRHLDLALIKVPTKGLTPLSLGDSGTLKNGQAIVALGHPRGLEYSVVAGVLSGTREVEGVSMLQVAIPIETGNSGGPVLDMQGRVQGVVTMKSLVTANLGFAVPVNSLKPLLAKPNPIPLDQWLTIGALDKTEWKTLLGGRWRQRAGRIIVDGTGTGFGGRTLGYNLRDVPKEAFDLAVTVKLDDESGAAGLIFGGDGGHQHYGFYPSGGKLRLTRFAGPDVFSWKILKEIKSEHYRPGDWNTIKVRIGKDKFSCYVNDQLVEEVEEPDYAGFLVGLAKFRDTVAEFKKFASAERLPAVTADAKVLAQIQKTLAALPKDKVPAGEKLGPLVKFPGEASNLLRDQARQLEKQAAHLRKLAIAVHHERCLQDLSEEFKKDEKDADLARAALLIARLDNEELDVEAYTKELDRLAREVTATLPKVTKPSERVEALNKFLFKDRGFHGSRHEYYSRNNSYLNEVIDDREGLPITLSVLYMELARRLDLKVVGVPLPGHFMVRHEPAKGKPQLIDPFDGGKLLSDKEAAAKVEATTGQALRKKDLEATTKKAIALRMLNNLINVAQGEKDRDSMLRYLDGIVAIDADAHDERWVRAVFRYQSGAKEGSLADCEYLLAHLPPDADIDRVRELRKLLLRDLER